MSARLLPVTLEQLTRLPAGVLVHEDVSGYASRTDIRDGDVWLFGIPEPRRAASVGPLHLVLTDTVTAAVVATTLVHPDAIHGGTHGGSYDTYTPCTSEEYEVVCLAAWMKPLTPAQTETLARLAREVMEDE